MQQKNLISKNTRHDSVHHDIMSDLCFEKACVNPKSGKTAEDRIYVSKILKQSLFKLYYTENSKTRGQTINLNPVLCCLQIQLYSLLVVVVVVLLFYVHGKHLRSCRDGQLT